jgi:AraC-like DNA-binding protein
MMTAKSVGAESVKYWVAPQAPGIELLRAKYTTQTFSRHIHDGYALGVIEQGALAFSYRGERLIAPAGTINLVIPGEAHDGQAATPAGWSYRMFYLESDLLEKVAAELFGRASQPFFSAGVIHDPGLASQIATVHRLLERQDSMKLEQEALVLNLLATFIARHSEQRAELCCDAHEDQAVKVAKEYIEAHYSENISLQDLVQACHLSSFYLIRIFRRRFGVPPHVFLKQVRIRRAKDCLAKGSLPVVVAQETGFVDQSHFSRQFKQITGLTPGQYSNSIQYDSHLPL